MEAPLLSSEVLEAELGPLVAEWELNGIGFRLSNAGDEEVVTVSHILWADNVYLFATDDKMADFMLRGVTRVLVDKLSLTWKAKSLEAMHGAHSRCVSREPFRTVAEEGKDALMPLVSAFRVLGETIDEDGQTRTSMMGVVAKQ